MQTSPSRQAGSLRRWLRIATIIASSWRTRLRFALGGNSGFTGLTHTKLNIGESLAYIDRVFSEYLQYGGLSPASLQNARVLEIGPGDNLGVALRFLAAGASKVVCLDKFDYRSSGDVESQSKIYRALRDTLSASEKANFDAALNLENGIVFAAEKLRCTYGSGVEDCGGVLRGEQFDLILSRAVLHEVFEIDAAFATMDKLLVPGGRMVHQIDLRDYRMFTALDLHPREFLAVPEFLYTQMVKGAARPNRRMMNYYRSKMRELGYDEQLYISGLVSRHDPNYEHMEEFIPYKTTLEFGTDYGPEHLAMNAEIRPRLLAPFRDLTDEELLAGAIMLGARKRHP